MPFILCECNLPLDLYYILHHTLLLYSGDTPAQLYQVLPEKRVDRVAGAMMASTHIYDMSGTNAPREGVPIVQPRGRVQLPGMSDQAVELALDPSELDLVDTEAMKARYEQQIREQSHLQKEDHSDMLADHLARQKVQRHLMFISFLWSKCVNLFLTHL